MFRAPSVYSSTDAWKRRPSHSSQGDSTVAITPSSVKMTPAPLQAGHAPSGLELNSAGFTPLALANALRIGSGRPPVGGGVLRRGARVAPPSAPTPPPPPPAPPPNRQPF